MSQRTDEIHVRLGLDGKQAINELGKLEAEANELKKTMKDAKTNSKEWLEAQKKLNELTPGIRAMREELGLSGMTMSQLKRHANDLKKQMDNTTTSGTQKNQELRQKLQQVNAEIAKQTQLVKGSEGVWAKLRKEIGVFGTMAVGFMGFQALTGKIGSVIEGSAKLSDSLANVMKTTGMTRVEVDNLYKSLGKFDTRTPRTELLKMAEIAGKLGKTSTKEIQGFVKAMDQINVALGEDLGDVDKVARDLGKLTQTFKIEETFGTEQALLKVGSAINALGAASTANEGYLVEFSKRMGGVAPLANMSIENILGLGATLDQLGQTAEVSSTALSKIFIKMASDSQNFAKYAKMEVEDFKRLVDTDMNAAFIKVLEGVKGNSQGMNDLATSLGDLGIEGGRVTGVLGVLSNNTETLKEQQILANEEFRKGTSITNEFNVKNENLAANLEKIQKWFNTLFVNGSMLKGLEQWISMIADAVKKTDLLSESMEGERQAVNLLVMEMTDANTTASRRKEIYEELEKIAPKILEGINKEAISYDRLRENLAKYNQELINRIVIQKQQEKIDEQNKKTAEALELKLKQEQGLRGMILATTQKDSAIKKEALAISQDENLSIDQKAEKILALAKAENLLYGNSSKGVGQYSVSVNNAFEQLDAAYQGFKIKTESLNQSKNVENLLLEEKLRLMRELGMMEEGGVVDTRTGGVGKDNYEIAETKDDAKKRKKHERDEQKEKDHLYKIAIQRYESYLKQLDELQKFHSTVEALDTKQRAKLEEGIAGELQLIDLKYQQLIDKALKNKEEINNLANLTDLEEKERKRLNDEYQFEIDELERLKEEEKQAKITAENEKIFHDRAALQEKLLNATLSNLELDLMATEKHYSDLIASAKKFGIDTTTLVTDREKQKLAIIKHYKMQEIAANANHVTDTIGTYADLYVGLSNLTAAFDEEMSTSSLEYAQFQKKLKLFGIATDTAKAISSTIASAAEASKNPVEMGIRIAAGIAVVMTNVAKAKQLMRAETEPKGFTFKPKKAFEEGGDTSGGKVNNSIYFKPTPSAELAWINEQGPEWIAPNWMYSSPKYQPIFSFLEHERVRGYAEGGDTSNNTTTPEFSSPVATIPQGKNDELLLQVMQRLLFRLDNPKPNVAIMDFDYLRDSITDIETIEKNATIGA
jgi:TP901 family phage tail tape measure protein